jgi:hypothetical protein
MKKAECREDDDDDFVSSILVNELCQNALTFVDDPYPRLREQNAIISELRSRNAD